MKGVELDFATFSRRLHLMARENGDWKIFRRFAIYERDRIDPVDPNVEPSAYYDSAALANYPQQIRHHLWRNDTHGSEPVKGLCIRGSEQETFVRGQAGKWIAGQPLAEDAGRSVR